MAKFEITPKLAIDEDELVFSTVRASGPGGQNVNKVETAVELRFDVWGSPSLDDETKRRLSHLSGSRLTNDGVLVIFAQTFRTQNRNKEDAVARLTALMAKALEREKPRVKTRPTLASKKRRVDTKVKHGATKRLRQSREE
jgi:ribosome-associated protein